MESLTRDEMMLANVKDPYISQQQTFYRIISFQVLYALLKYDDNTIDAYYPRVPRGCHLCWW